MPAKKAQPAKRPSEHFAEQVRSVRTRKGWNQQQLADRLAEIGTPMDRATVARTETGGRGVPIDEVFAFALALDVSVEALLTPRGSDDVVQVAPACTARAESVRKWMCGRDVLDDVKDKRFFFMEAPDEEWNAQTSPAITATARLESTIRAAVGHPNTEMRKVAQTHLRRELDRVVSEVEVLAEDGVS